MVQLIEASEVCRAMALALTPGVRGVYNVVGPGEVPLSAAFDELGRRPIRLPHPLARAVAQRLWDARLSSFPPPELDHVQYLCTVDGSRFVRDAGWKPIRTLRETIRSVEGEDPLAFDLEAPLP
jgi:UDP-glucose 4-epimerase